ncbi:hypothetical protein [Leptospira limi]|uniref:Uncharacterized protein n=1 Tax=Leptospira limi TaxID=2950023 RepID=A0ABT3LX79_9LEPT|nr:hypothetical protein [Leptospira limi]MCW7462095.1 hypothetical protein [Leptospira limi]
MSVKELFLSYWRSPVLSPEEVKIEVLKKEKKQKLVEIESRLESLEILISNDKLADANILFNYVVYDLVNYYQSLNGKKEIPKDSDLSSFQLPETKSKAFQFLKNFNQHVEVTETKLNEIFEGCLITYNFLIDESKSFFRSKMETKLDRFKQIRKIRIISITSILLLSLISVLYYQYKFPVLKDQSIKMYTFVDKEHPQTSESLMVSLPVTKSGVGVWNEYVFTLPEPMSKFGGLRIDPLEQRGIRFVLDDLQILDTNGKVLYSKKITVSQSLLPEDYQDFLEISDIKTAGRQLPGELVEMISTGRDPKILLVFPTLENAKTIKVKMKYIEAHKVKKK